MFHICFLREQRKEGEIVKEMIKGHFSGVKERVRQPIEYSTKQVKESHVKFLTHDISKHHGEKGSKGGDGNNIPHTRNQNSGYPRELNFAEPLSAEDKESNPFKIPQKSDSNL